AAHGTHYSICEVEGAAPLIMVRMLMAGDGRHLFRPVILLRGLARQVGDADHPAQPGFGSILPRRHHPGGAVERAGHDLDPRAADPPEAQWRAAVGAEIALGDGGGLEGGRLPAGPGEDVVRT